MRLLKPNLFLVLIIFLAAFLRLYKLGDNPPSLYWDEVSLGWNAYSILKTGNDEFGRHLPVDAFTAFGDYKPPLYIYMVVPSVAIFGLSEFAVRFPSALFGTLTVILAYLIVFKLYKKKSLAQAVALLVAISPWHIQVSRAAYEANLGLFFTILGVWFFLESVDRFRGAIVLSFLSFLASAYTFNSNRIVAPILIAFLFVIYFKKIVLRWFLLALAITVIFSLPLLKHLKTPEGQLRFQEVSIFNNLETVKMSNIRKSVDANSWFANIIHNRRVSFSLDFLSHYFSHFEGKFLFISGDVNPRLSIQDVGSLYLVELPFLLSGFYFLIKNKEKGSWVVFLLLAVSPIPAGIAKETPHALRALLLVIPLEMIVGYGIYNLWQGISKKTEAYKKVWIFTLGALFIFSVILYQENYWKHYPKEFSSEWQYGYKELVGYVNSVEDKYDLIRISEGYGRPYIYFLFYTKDDPAKFYSQVDRFRDDQGFYHVKGFGKYQFGQFNWENPPEGKRVLDITYAPNSHLELKPIKTIYLLDGKTLFNIYSSENVPKQK